MPRPPSDRLSSCLPHTHGAPLACKHPPTWDFITRDSYAITASSSDDQAERTHIEISPDGKVLFSVDELVLVDGVAAMYLQESSGTTISLRWDDSTDCISDVSSDLEFMMSRGRFGLSRVRTLGGGT